MCLVYRMDVAKRCRVSLNKTLKLFIALFLYTNVISCQIFVLVSKSILHTSGRYMNHIEWYLRSTSRFVSLEVEWERTLFSKEILFKTPWTRFTTDRVIYPALIDVDDASVRIIRHDPDIYGMEEIRVQFNGTIDHTSLGRLRCTVTTENGKTLTKYADVYINIKCIMFKTHTVSKYYCEPEGYGWFRGYIDVALQIGNENVVLKLYTPGFEYIEYRRGCFLSCYLGPGGPIVSITAYNTYTEINNLIIKLNSQYAITNQFMFT